MYFIIDSVHGDPGSPLETREEAFAIIDGMVADGIAEPGEFSVIEYDERGWPTGPPFVGAQRAGAPSGGGRGQLALGRPGMAARSATEPSVNWTNGELSDTGGDSSVARSCLAALGAQCSYAIPSPG